MANCFNPNQKTYRLLELYSGIGGMRFALEDAGIPYELVAAVDINPIVNEIYKFNFGHEGHLQRNIQSFSTDEIEKMKVDIITMSPPCQPFTRVGLKKDIDDARTDSFLHFLNIISCLSRKPLYLVLENVEGFEMSKVRGILIDTIEKSGYTYVEFLLTPLDLGIPNSRRRYYLFAKQGDINNFTPKKIITSIPPRILFHKPSCIKDFLEQKPWDYFQDFQVTDVLLKYWTTLDIVDEDSLCSCCFTRAYGRYGRGTGSLLKTQKNLNIFEEMRKIEQMDDKDKLTFLKNLKIRYFTPKEIANLMCFPDRFAFPENITLQQKYKALGNSINVYVVSCLLLYLM